MKIALCSIGSRGDIQSFLILGEYLSQQGHEVKVASAKIYESLASNYALEYIAFEGDYESIMDDDALKKKIGKNPFALGKALKEQVYPIIENSLTTFYSVSEWADVVLYHPKTMLDGISYEMKDKLIKTYVVPLFSPTKAFANPLFTFLPIPTFLNRLTYKLVNALMSSMKTPIKKFREKNNLANSSLLLETPVLYGISPAFLKRPADYPTNHHYAGFWMKDNKKHALSKEITAFMGHQKKVVILTFGSMPYQSKTDINEFVSALIVQYNIKILLVRGWGLKTAKIKERNEVLAIDAAPFEHLFPLAWCVIHHGGAGTTAIALQAGIPQMICPVLHPVGDQYFWGKQVEKMQVGVKPIPLKKLTVKKLLDSFGHLKNEQLKINAETLQKRISLENGLETAKKIIEKHYQQQK